MMTLGLQLLLGPRLAASQPPPANINITVRASIEAATGHRIISDFPEIKVSSEGGQWEPKLISAEGNLNGGGPVLKVRTTMGNIYIRRAQ